MFRQTIVPLDLAQRNGAKITYLGVTATTPTSVAQSPAEFGDRLDSFAKEQAVAHGLQGATLVVQGNDPPVDMTRQIIAVVEGLKRDLVIMQRHAPGLADCLFEGRGPYLAQHAKASVMPVRA